MYQSILIVRNIRMQNIRTVEKSICYTLLFLENDSFIFFIQINCNLDAFNICSFSKQVSEQNTVKLESVQSIAYLLKSKCPVSSGLMLADLVFC